MPLSKRERHQKKRNDKAKRAKAKLAARPRRVADFFSIELAHRAAPAILLAITSHMRMLRDAADKDWAPEIKAGEEVDRAEFGYQYMMLQATLRQLYGPARNALLADEEGHLSVEDAQKSVDEMDFIRDAQFLADDLSGGILRCVNAAMGSEGVKTDEGWQWKLPE